MTDQKQLNSTDQWTSPQAYILAVICLLLTLLSFALMLSQFAAR